MLNKSLDKNIIFKRSLLFFWWNDVNVVVSFSMQCKGIHFCICSKVNIRLSSLRSIKWCPANKFACKNVFKASTRHLWSSSLKNFLKTSLRRLPKDQLCIGKWSWRRRLKDVFISLAKDQSYHKYKTRYFIVTTYRRQLWKLFVCAQTWFSVTDIAKGSILVIKKIVRFL